MKSMDGVDYDKDWKFITLQIGSKMFMNLKRNF